MFSGGDRSVAEICGASSGAQIGKSAPDRIVAVQGGESADIQALLSSLAEHWRASGLKVVGVVEDITPGVRKACGGSLLRNVRSGARYPLYQDLGPHSTACCLDPAGVAAACQDIISEMDACDVVILSKFGKLEAERSGLLDAFVRAGFLDKPVLTSASPTFSPSYLGFVGQFGALAPADEHSLNAWMSRHRP